MVSLHNYLINATYCISGAMKEEMGGGQNLQESFLPLRYVGLNNLTKTAKQTCEMLVDYFMSNAGKIKCQKGTIKRTLHNFHQDFV